MTYFPKIVSVTHMWVDSVGSTAPHMNSLISWQLTLYTFVVVVYYWNPQPWFFSSIIFSDVTFLCIRPSLIWWLCLDALSITVEWHIKNNIILNTRFVMTGHNKYQKHLQWTPGNRIKLFTDFEVRQDWTTARKRQKVYEFNGINTSKFGVIFI